MIEIHKFLKTVEKHGSDDLSVSCETCVQIKNGIKIIDEALKLRELVNEIGLINLIQFRMEHLLKDISPPNEPSKSQVEFKMIEFEKLQKSIQSLRELK